MGYLMRSRQTDFWNIVSPITVFLSPSPYSFLRIPFPRWSSLVTLQSAVCGLRIEKDKERKWPQVLVNTQHFSGPISSVYTTSLLRVARVAARGKLQPTHPTLNEFWNEIYHHCFYFDFGVQKWLQTYFVLQENWLQTSAFIYAQSMIQNNNLSLCKLDLCLTVHHQCR